MGAVVFLCTLALVAAVVLLVSAPLRAAQAGETPMPDPGEAAGAARRDELRAAREAKYREIRDAELDYRTGKLSAEDYRTIDTELRAEALEILNALEELEGPQPEPAPSSQLERPAAVELEDR